jgi:hypothetical protein
LAYFTQSGFATLQIWRLEATLLDLRSGAVAPCAVHGPPLVMDS